MKQIFNFCAVAVFVLTVLASCAGNPPKDERELAEKAFADAEAGKDCDRENYLAAEELLRQAREEINNKNYDKAATASARHRWNGSAPNGSTCFRSVLMKPSDWT